MTQEQSIDVLVAKYVLNHSILPQKKGVVKERTRLGQVRPLRRYSRDIAAAWEIVDQLGITLIPVQGSSWFALVGKGRAWESPSEFIQYVQTGEFAEGGAAVTDNPAMSICLAALRSVEKVKDFQFEDLISNPLGEVH